jgi:hypothetical protein
MAINIITTAFFICSAFLFFDPSRLLSLARHGSLLSSIVKKNPLPGAGFTRISNLGVQSSNQEPF